MPIIAILSKKKHFTKYSTTKMEQKIVKVLFVENLPKNPLVYHLTYLIYYFIAPLAFSDGSWWLTGGLDGQTQQPSLEATFFDKILIKLVPGKRLSSPQAGHCIAEVAKSFISAGGYTEKV